PKYGVSTAGDQEIAQELAPVEGIGPLRSLAFDSLQNGTYCTDNIDQDHKLPQTFVNWGAIPAPVPLFPNIAVPVTCQKVPDGELHDLMQEYKDLVAKYGGALPNLTGILNIVEVQPNLK